MRRTTRVFGRRGGWGPEACRPDVLNSAMRVSPVGGTFYGCVLAAVLSSGWR
jgi:hypothetical protein